MIRTAHVECPNCRAPDETSFEVEDADGEFLVTTNCESCFVPYVIGITFRFAFRTGTIDMGDSNA